MSLEKRLEAALRKGDRSSLEKVFSDIYSTYFKLACYIASNYLPTKEDVEDAANDAFINFFNHLEGFNPKGSIKYYIATSSKNIAINMTKKMREQIEFDDEILGGADRPPNEEPMLIEIMERVLSQDEIALINEHAIEGVPLREIARAKGDSPNTVKSKYLRAIKKLREEFNKGG